TSGPRAPGASTTGARADPPHRDETRGRAMTDIASLLGDDAEALLSYEVKGIPKEDLTLPGPDIIDRVYSGTDRNPQVLRNLGSLFGHGRLAGTGHVSILP